MRLRLQRRRRRRCDVTAWLAGDVADSMAPLVPGWSLGNGGIIIAEIHNGGEDCNITEVSGLKLCAVRHDGFELLRGFCSILKYRIST